MFYTQSLFYTQYTVRSQQSAVLVLYWWPIDYYIILFLRFVNASSIKKTLSQVIICKPHRVLQYFTEDPENGVVCYFADNIYTAVYVCSEGYNIC